MGLDEGNYAVGYADIAIFINSNTHRLEVF
jgi:hypothetical protein